MVCPDRAVERQGGGAALIKNPDLAIKIIQAAKVGSDGLPVSVKTRLGYNKIDFDWLRVILEQKISALTVHLRTRKEMSDGPAHWEIMPEIIKMRDRISPQTLIIGNGDVQFPEEAMDKMDKYGCDGIMIGRGIFGKPWLFENIDLIKTSSPNKVSIHGQNNKDIRRQFKIMLEHTKSFEKEFKGIKNFAIMKKHFKAYVSGFDCAREFRIALMGAQNAKEVSKIIRKFFTHSFY